MLSRNDYWTQMYIAYHEGTYSHEYIAKKLAAACLTLRDAEWAMDIYPFCSHGLLGLSTTRDYATACRCRAVWIGADADHHPIATFQDKFGQGPSRTERVADLGETTLKALVDWVREEDA